MNECKADNWSIQRAFALLAAVFAILVGSLLPYAAMAAVQPGQSIVICSTQGLQTIHVDEDGIPTDKGSGAKCAACILPLTATLPAPAPSVPAPVIRLTDSDPYTPLRVAAPPPSRAPPRPPSTAPPHA
ncbi:DUF2946 family protein [uncultured Brevundimonas sp.]|uniref:DUF2946 family protein n=1 Tax=uncultured Brevundimonas sp. TaxID=213418 RepID=UPI00263573CA|nr:DUF2946 family protein [uncultured Brevundimonas sp.]